jgi:hypothetical protein
MQMFGFFKRKDVEVENIKAKYEGKYLVELLKTKINRSTVFWVGRSKNDQSIRIGIETAQGRRYFLAWTDFLEDPRIRDMQIMTPREADELELRVKKKLKNP